MSDRTDLHDRTLSIETHPLSGGRLFVHAELRDVRHVELPAYLGAAHPPGVVHHMAMDAELDRELVLRDVAAYMATAPFEPAAATNGEGCRLILENYRRMIGLRIDEAYPLRVLEGVGGTQGCFHLLSLAQCLPAAVRTATGRLCAAALRRPAGAHDGVRDSCAQWRDESPLWGEARESPGDGFRDFRRHVRVTAYTTDGTRLGLVGRLRDEPAGAPESGAELTLELGFPSFTIVSAEARLDPPPFSGCAAAASGVTRLRHLSVLKGFTGAALEKIGGGAGCAQASALLIAMTPVTAQAAGAIAGFLGFGPDRKPRERGGGPQVDSCHMWRAGGPLAGRDAPVSARS